MLTLYLSYRELNCYLETKTYTRKSPLSNTDLSVQQLLKCHYNISSMTHCINGYARNYLHHFKLSFNTQTKILTPS